MRRAVRRAARCSARRSQAAGNSVSHGLVVGRVAGLVALSGEAGADEISFGDARLDQWISASRGRRTNAVWRRGRQVVTNGRHVAHAETARRYARVLSRILDLGNE